MGLISSFNPGSIRTVYDMRRAIAMVLDDLFDDVGSTGSSGPNSIDFLIESDNPRIDLDLEIQVIDHGKAGARDERHVVNAWRASGLSVRDTLLAIEGGVSAESDGDEEASRALIARWQELCVPIPEPLQSLGRRAAPEPDDDEPFRSPARRLADDDQGEADDRLADDERRLLAAYRVLGIPLGEALRRLESEPLDVPAAGPQAKAPARCCEPGEGCRFGIRRLLGLT